MQASKGITAGAGDETYPTTEICGEVCSGEDDEEYAVEFIVDVRIDHHVSIATCEDKPL